MICKKCGAQIPDNYVYCGSCGAEVQLVPDYNLLDEDVLGHIIQKEAKGQEGSSTSKSGRKAKKGQRKALIWCVIGVFLLILTGASLLTYQGIQKKQYNSYSYQFQKAEGYFLEGDFIQAKPYYQRALELKPGDRDVLKRLVALYLEEEEETLAIPILEGWAQEGQLDRDDCQTLIEIYDKKEEYDKILSLYDQTDEDSLLELFTEYLVEPPVFSSASGTYEKPLTIAILAEEEEILYTTDGQDPVRYGIPYQSAISLEEEGTTVILTVARNEKGICSETAKATYTIRYEPPEMPSVSPSGGTYPQAQAITIHPPDGCTAYYTWDGSDPTEASAKYTGPLEMPQGNQVLSVIAVDEAGLKSCIYRVNYVYMP